MEDQEGQQGSIDFSTFLLSLYHNALLNLDEPMSSEEPSQVHLPMAQHFIEIIGMLKNKTKNNLSEQENKLLQQILSELKWKFVELKKKTS